MLKIVVALVTFSLIVGSMLYVLRGAHWIDWYIGFFLHTLPVACAVSFLSIRITTYTERFRELKDLAHPNQIQSNEPTPQGWYLNRIIRLVAICGVLLVYQVGNFIAYFTLQNSSEIPDWAMYYLYSPFFIVGLLTIFIVVLLYEY